MPARATSLQNLCTNINRQPIELDSWSNLRNMRKVLQFKF